MDLATLAGIIAGLVVVLVAIMLDGSLGTFVNLPGLMIVVGGTMAATAVKFTMSDMLSSFKLGLSIAFRASANDPQQLYDHALEMAGIIRKNGLLALEGYEVPNDLFQRGVDLCIDGYDKETLEETLSREAQITLRNQEKGELMFRGIGESAPAFGMIGTLVGLVQMLANLDDPNSIGPAMAVAMLTTFYGALIANLIAIPIADKLKSKSKQDKMVQEQILNSVLMLQQNKSPTVIEQSLKIYVTGTGSSGGDDGNGKKK